MLGPELRAVHQGPTHASSARPGKWMGAERSKREESQRRRDGKACSKDDKMCCFQQVCLL